MFVEEEHLYFRISKSFHHVYVIKRETIAIIDTCATYQTRVTENQNYKNLVELLEP